MTVRGIRVVFDPALDGPGWPGPLAGRTAAFGECWLGELGLLARLETELGLVAAYPSAIERAMMLASELRPHAGDYWAASFATDPLATAQRMLADRDLLAMSGWNGEAVSERLSQLWSATAGASPGVADRLRRVAGMLVRERIDLERITMLEAIDTLPPLWRAVLEALQRIGVVVETVALTDAPATGDVAAARHAPFVPAGDGRLKLVRAQGALAAADEVAAALAAYGSLDGVVVVNPDAVLDAALVRHGVPRLGWASGTAASGAFVRLVLATAFSPMEPDDLHALLVADPGPIPRKVGTRLASALGKLPARGSPLWTAALAEGLAQIEDERRDDVAARIAALVDPVVNRDDALAVEQLTARLRTLATWAHGRAQTIASLRATAMMVERAITLARVSGRRAFDRIAVRRLLDELEQAVVGSGPAEVGLAAVSDPGAVVGPARVVFWWNFTRDAAPGAPRLRLSRAEREALRAAGIEPMDPGAVMAAAARRWRRPLLQATESVVLVCPHTDEGGERTHPHPLWDELTATIPDGVDRSCLLASALATPRRQRMELRPLVVATDTARTAPLALRALESPSSLETLLACSLRWSLQYIGKLYSNVGAGPGEPGPLLYGNLAHHVLADVFGGGVVSPDEAARRATEMVDAGLEHLAESLLLPDYQRQRAELRRGLIESAREMARVLATTGASVRGVEQKLAGPLADVNVEGTSDLLLSGPDLVIDYKWGTSTYKKLLASGTAFQLVAYAALAQQGSTLPEVAYLALSTQQLFATPSAGIANAVTPGVHTTQDMLDGALTAIGKRRDELARGELSAPAALEDVEDEGLADGVMQLVPKCQYCSFGALCGKTVRS